jgi:crotonobetainyl-CoA:carnitine CoA-transferase CaiB-like acyl-CoA transferase
MLTLLRGITVIDMTTIVLGPMATRIIADLGAEVVKIEAPSGDLVRTTPPSGEDGVSALFHNHNRNKRSLAVNLKCEAGREVIRRLVARADVLVHNMRPKAMKGLGFSPEACLAINPRLIYCAAVGFGSDGPYAGRPAYDDIIQAASGIAALPALLGREPAYVPSVIADKVTALYVVYAVLAGLFERGRTGNGREIEVPMFETMVSFVLSEHLAGATFDDAGHCGYHRLIAPERRPFPTADGWIAILAYTREQWTRLLTNIGRGDVVDSDWFPDASERSRRSGYLYAMLAEATPQRTTAEWLTTFEHLDIPHSPVNTPDDLLADPHLVATGFFAPRPPGRGIARSLPQPVRFPGAPQADDAHAPRLGADTAAILRGLGYRDDEIAAMARKGTVVTTSD